MRMDRKAVIGLPLAILALAVVILLIGAAFLVAGMGDDDGRPWNGPEDENGREPIAYLYVSADIRCVNPIGDDPNLKIMEVLTDVTFSEPDLPEEASIIDQLLGLFSDHKGVKVTFEVNAPGYGEYKDSVHHVFTVGENDVSTHTIDASAPWMIYEHGTYNVEVRIYDSDDNQLGTMSEAVTI